MLEQTPSYLPRGAQHQQLGAEADQRPCGPTKSLLAIVKRWKLTWFGHVMHHGSLSNSIPRGILEVGWRAVACRGNARWTTSRSRRLLPDLLTIAFRRNDRKRTSAEPSLMSPRWPIGLNWTGIVFPCGVARWTQKLISPLLRIQNYQ